MSVYVVDLAPSLARELGDTDTNNLYYSDDVLFSAFYDGIGDFNTMCASQEYEISSSGSTAYFNPEPSEDDQRLLVLHSAVVILRGEQAKASRVAFIHSNAAGRTDLSRASQAIEFQLLRLDKQIKNIWRKRTRDKTEKDISGAELRSIDTEDRTYVEGLPITTITTTN